MYEAQLLRSCLHGDRAAQFELVRQYGPRLLTVCRRYVPDGHDPQDALQDAFVNAFTHLHRFDAGKADLWTWLKTIAIREALKKHRGRRTWTLNGHEVASETPGPDLDQALNSLQTEQLLQLIRQLPDGYREVFNLVAVEGYSHEECAGLLGIAPGTSRSCLSRARRILQERYHQQHAYGL
jgi:RNA polymerase sigma factor (sigma-70 family)